MTNLMRAAIEALRDVPPAAQDELARIVLQLTGKGQTPHVCGPEEAAALDQANAEAERGDFATDEHVRAIWAKYDL